MGFVWPGKVEKEFNEFLKRTNERESVLDGVCKHWQVTKGFSRLHMERCRFLHNAGVHGKTRIVIEYDNDAGEGWVRIVTEDANTVPIPRDPQGRIAYPPFDPIQSSQ